MTTNTPRSLKKARVALSPEVSEEEVTPYVTLTLSWYVK
jgi:hypothetical protein